MCFGRFIIDCMIRWSSLLMQVARSLRIRSRNLAIMMPAGKARRTQAQLHAATRGNVRLHADTSLLPERSMYANPHSSDAHSPKQMTAVSTACRPAVLVAELPSNLARGLSGRRDFGPRMGGTLSTHSTHSTLTTRASISTLRSSHMTSYTLRHNKN